MNTFFKIFPHQQPNGKWNTGYIKYIQSGNSHREQKGCWPNEFNTKEEANQYATGYCLQQGYIFSNQ